MASPVRYYEQFYSERRAGSTLLHAPAMREHIRCATPDCDWGFRLADLHQAGWAGRGGVEA
jgi:hypothetical protein